MLTAVVGVGVLAADPGGDDPARVDSSGEQAGPVGPVRAYTGPSQGEEDAPTATTEVTVPSSDDGEPDGDTTAPDDGRTTTTRPGRSTTATTRPGRSTTTTTRPAAPPTTAVSCQNRLFGDPGTEGCGAFAWSRSPSNDPVVVQVFVEPGDRVPYGTEPVVRIAWSDADAAAAHVSLFLGDSCPPASPSCSPQSASHSGCRVPIGTWDLPAGKAGDGLVVQTLPVLPPGVHTWLVAVSTYSTGLPRADGGCSTPDPYSSTERVDGQLTVFDPVGEG